MVCPPLISPLSSFNQSVRVCASLCSLITQLISLSLSLTCDGSLLSATCPPRLRRLSLLLLLLLLLLLVPRKVSCCRWQRRRRHQELSLPWQLAGVLHEPESLPRLVDRSPSFHTHQHHRVHSARRRRQRHHHSEPGQRRAHSQDALRQLPKGRAVHRPTRGLPRRGDLQLRRRALEDPEKDRQLRVQQQVAP